MKETITRRVKGQTMTRTNKGWRTAGRKSGKTRVKTETPPVAALGTSPSSHVLVNQTGRPPLVPSSPSSGSGSTSSAVTPMPSTTSLEPPVPKKSSACKKRPLRSAASTVKSYLVPDSDDESILDEHKPDSVSSTKSKEAEKKKAESNLQRWIKHLTALQKEELKKVGSRLSKQSSLSPELCVVSTTRRRSDWKGMPCAKCG